MRILLILSYSLFASGLTVHLYMSDKAVEFVTSKEMKSFLIKEKASYRSGTLFPDTGYPMYGHNKYGEYAHWSPFLNSYKTYLANNCMDFSKTCSQLFAHFLGSLAHTIEDNQFDRYFLTAVSEHDHLESAGHAQSIVDTGLDFIVLEDHKNLRNEFSKKIIPLQILKNLLKESGEEISDREILTGHKWLWAALIGERFVAPYYTQRYRNAVPWAMNNYQSVQGGITPTAKIVAKHWEQIWNKVQKEGFMSLHDIFFFETGQWPEITFQMIIED